MRRRSETSSVASAIFRCCSRERYRRSSLQVLIHSERKHILRRAGGKEREGKSARRIGPPAPHCALVARQTDFARAGAHMRVGRPASTVRTACKARQGPLRGRIGTSSRTTSDRRATTAEEPVQSAERERWFRRGAHYCAKGALGSVCQRCHCRGWGHRRTGRRSAVRLTSEALSVERQPCLRCATGPLIGSNAPRVSRALQRAKGHCPASRSKGHPTVSIEVRRSIEARMVHRYGLCGRARLQNLQYERSAMVCRA
jgi:hypothetical protein